METFIFDRALDLFYHGHFAMRNASFKKLFHLDEKEEIIKSISETICSASYFFKMGILENYYLLIGLDKEAKLVRL